MASAAAHLVVSASPQAFWPRWATATAIAAAWVGLGWSFWSQRTSWTARWLAFLALSIPGSLLCASLVTRAWLFQPRFLALALPALVMLLAFSFASLVETRRQRVGRVALAAVWLSVQIAGLVSFYIHPVHGRDGLREIGTRLTARVASGDAVVSNHPLLLWSVAQYYPGELYGLPSNWDVRWGYPLLPPSQPAWVQAQLDSLPRVVSDAPRLWLLYLPVVDPDGKLLATIQTQYQIVEARAYPLLTVYLFARRSF